MKGKKCSKLLVGLLTLTMSVWALAGCGGSSSGEEAAENPDVYTASEITSDLPVAADVQNYYDSIDMEYAYNISHELAYSEELGEHLGWRLAGSEAEHKCADFLAKEMEDIGLENVDKIAVDCDSFSFKDSELKIEGTEIDLQPASYQVNGTGAEGIDAEIVNCGKGMDFDFEGKDLEGKILLMGVDQSNEAWIDTYIREAAELKAAGLVTYSYGGYGELNKDTVNVQDVCCPDMGVPTGAISNNEARIVKKAIKAGNNKCHFMLDAVMGDDDGTSYNVVGMIPGKSHDQQIIVSGHYDKYWYGFQDDCCAIGLVLSVGKAMVDAGYKPENDIVFVCHGAEEWGTTGSQFDWTTGAWQMVDTAKTEWADKTIAMINCELPAFKTESGNVGIGCVPEFRTVAEKFVDSGLLVTEGKIGFDRKAFDSTTMEDGIAYRWHGVPYFINSFEDSIFMSHRYHTSFDNDKTYNKNTFNTNINWYGALAMYLDTTPALELDMTQTAKDLKKDFGKKIAKEAGVDTEKYLAAVTELKTAAKANNKAINSLNTEYADAVANEDKDAMAKIRKDAIEQNQKSLQAFAEVQDDLLIDNDFEVFYGHRSMNSNVKNIKGTLKGLEDKNLGWEDGAIAYAYNINAIHNYGYCYHSIDVVDDIVAMYDNANLTAHKDQWGYEKQAPVIYGLGEATKAITAAADAEDDSDLDYKATEEVFQKALDDTLKNIKERCADEVNYIGAVTKKLQ